MTTPRFRRPSPCWITSSQIIVQIATSQVFPANGQRSDLPAERYIRWFFHVAPSSSLAKLSRVPAASPLIRAVLDFRGGKLGRGQESVRSLGKPNGFRTNASHRQKGGHSSQVPLRGVYSITKRQRTL